MLTGISFVLILSNMNDKLQVWIDALQAALKVAGLNVSIDQENLCGNLKAVISVTKEAALPKAYTIRLHKLATGIQCVAHNPYVKRDVRLVYKSENVEKVVEYATHQINGWISTVAKENARVRRKAAGQKIARDKEITELHLPAWARVTPLDDDDANIGKFRVFLIGHAIGYPLRSLTPDQIKAVVHFLSRIDKDEIRSAIYAGALLEELVKLVSIICGGQRDVTIEDCDPAKQLIIQLTGNLELMEGA